MRSIITCGIRVRWRDSRRGKRLRAQGMKENALRPGGAGDMQRARTVNARLPRLPGELQLLSIADRPAPGREIDL
jgi:hypothetical protein